MTRYVVLRYQPWTSLDLSGMAVNATLTESSDGCTGFLPVYGSLDDARAAFPDDEIVAMRPLRQRDHATASDGEQEREQPAPEGHEAELGELPGGEPVGEGADQGDE